MEKLKNLLIYINSSKSFNGGDWGNEGDILVKIQIDNSLELGWKPGDIMLVTNFYYKYKGVESIVIEDDNYCEFSSGTPSKINAILTLFDKGLIEDKTLYWFHDFDAFQQEDIRIDLDDSKIGLTDYGITTINESYNRRWSTGSIFFKKGSKDVFEWIKTAVYKYTKNEEVSLLALTRHNKHKILDRIEKINITYNFATRKRDIDKQYEISDTPIKIIHFHPFDTRSIYKGYKNNEICIQGKNLTNKPLVTQRLINIFKKHKIC